MSRLSEKQDVGNWWSLLLSVTVLILIISSVSLGDSFSALMLVIGCFIGFVYKEAELLRRGMEY